MVALLPLARSKRLVASFRASSFVSVRTSMPGRQITASAPGLLRNVSRMSLSSCHAEACHPGPSNLSWPSRPARPNLALPTQTSCLSHPGAFNSLFPSLLAYNQDCQKMGCCYTTCDYSCLPSTASMLLKMQWQREAFSRGVKYGHLSI